MKVPYVIYADFECILVPFSSATRDPMLMHSFTDKKQLHRASSYCYYIVSNNKADPVKYEPVLYRGPNAVQHFWRSIRTEVEKIALIYGKEEKIYLKPGEREQLQKQCMECHICGKKLVDLENESMPVLDHDHLTGDVRGWACSTCNLAYQLPKFVPIIFHNGSNYDFKLLVPEIHSACNMDTKLGKRVLNQDMRRKDAKRRKGSDFLNDEAIEVDEEDDDEYSEDTDILGFDEDLANQDIELEEKSDESGMRRRRSRAKKVGDISILAKNCENFISFEVQVTEKLSARFIDSFRFMSSSLDSLARNLDEG